MTVAAAGGKLPLGVIGSYTLLDELGRGAHGSVYRARSRDGDVVALKIIEDNSSLDRLLLEPQLLEKLHHPNIVGLRDYFLHGGKVVLVMEYVEGTDLATHIARGGAFSAAETREFLVQMAGAIAHAHGHGIVHSDLKPSNILVDTRGETPRYVIVDFGVSRIANGLTMTRRLAGTYAFMAPEQLRGRGGMQSDLWALGTIAYFLLTGEAPFRGETRQEIGRQIIYVQPSLPPQLSGDDAALERTIVHLLEKRTTGRTASASALLQELTGSALQEASSEVPYLKTLPAWEQALQDEVRKSHRRIMAWVIVAFLPDGILPGMVMLVGVYLLYLGQLRRNAGIVGGGFAVIFAAFVAFSLSADVQGLLFGKTGAMILMALSFFFGLFLLPAAANFVRARAAERELALLQALRTADLGRTIDVLRTYVTSASGDTSMRLRYIEALLTARRADEAAVEAQLLLELDPYNLGAALLLANAYLDLGLLERCDQVCNWYLSVSPHCFEFEELRQNVSLRRQAA